MFIKVVLGYFFNIIFVKFCDADIWTWYLEPNYSFIFFCFLRRELLDFDFGLTKCWSMVPGHSVPVYKILKCESKYMTKCGRNKKNLHFRKIYFIIVENERYSSETVVLILIRVDRILEWKNYTYLCLLVFFYCGVFSEPNVH